MTNQPDQSVTEQEFRKVLALSIGRKSVVVALVLWFFFGYLGIHRMYLGKVASGVMMAVITVLGVLTMVFMVGFLLLFIVFIWWVVDFVLIILQARKHNKMHDTIAGNIK